MYDKICSACGTRLSTFYKTLMLGCPNCYKAFEGEIIASAQKIHGATVHVGKTPKTGGVDKDFLMEYEDLIKERERATLEGDFLRVNEISKDITEIAKELKKRGLI